MAKTRFQADAVPQASDQPATGRINKPSSRHKRPNPRQRQRLREMKRQGEEATDKKTSQEQAEAHKNLGPEGSSFSPRAAITEKQAKKKRRPKGNPNRVYYGRPNRLDARFDGLSKGVNNLIERAVDEGSKSLGKVLGQKEQTFRTYNKIYDFDRAWDDQRARERRERDIENIKIFIEATVKKHVEAQRLDWTRLNDKHRAELEGKRMEMLKEVQERRLEVFEGMESQLEELSNRMKNMEEKMDNLQRASNDPSRWAMRTPAPLIEDSD